MDEDIAEKLREENPEQFFILVRMHLSFLIDMNTDENDSPVDKPKPFKWGFSKKSKNGDSIAPKSVTGSSKSADAVTLTEETINQIYQLIDVLSEDEYLCQEGIFRRTGSLSRQQLLRELLSSGRNLSKEVIENASYNAHDMASVLKGILAETPEPLFLNHQHQAYCHLAATCFDDGQPLTESEPRLIGALRLLLLLLPYSVRLLARRLLTLLHKTAARENNNRMSTSSLATMFTPHLMCPRKLSPKSLHTESRNLAPILSFMIRKSPVLFTTPPHLATDIAAYLAKKQQRRLLSPNGEDLNESVSERSAASTVFTFVDRQASSAAASASTDAALAQLYAHIQALPESHNKRRLVKQFNRENGHGTPLQLQRAQKQRSLGESLKKHIFNKSLMNGSIKKSIMTQSSRFPSVSQNTPSSKEIIVETPALILNSNNNTPIIYTESIELVTIKTDEKANSKMSILDTPKSSKENSNFVDELAEEVHPDDSLSDDHSVDLDEGTLSCDEGRPSEKIQRPSAKYTSEPNLSFIATVHQGDTPKFYKKATKIFNSKSSLAGKKHDIRKLQKQNSGSGDERSFSDHSLNIYKSCVKCATDSCSEAEGSVAESKIPDVDKECNNITPRVCKKDSVKYLRSKRKMSTESSASLKGSPVINDAVDNSKRNIDNIDGNDVKIKVKLLPSKLSYLTSTPSVSNVLLNEEKTNYEGCTTPLFAGGRNLRRGSMSPITKSTQKMSKAMQESIMTPRSRKPVIMNYDPAPSMLPCHNSHHSASCSELSSSDNIYDTSSSSMKNDSDFVSTDSSRSPSFTQIKYKQIGNKQYASNSSNGSEFDVLSNASSDRKLRIHHGYNRAKAISESKRRFFEENACLNDGKEPSLTYPFREYLMCRSVLTSSCIDLSFNSESGDFQDPSLQDMSENKMTESLLFCMNGNKPPDLTGNSEFDCSDRETLLENSLNIVKPKVYDLKLTDSRGNSVKSETNSADKENMSPALKRSAQGSSGNLNSVDREGSGNKKVNISSDVSLLNTAAQVNCDLNRHLWDFEKYGPMWETDL